MYRIFVKSNFSSAHKLAGYEGNCERIHGHNWSVQAEIMTNMLDAAGIGYDFRKFKKQLNAILEPLDHRLLNEIPPFDRINPSSENLAKYIFDSLKQKLPSDIIVKSIEVKESENCAVIYSEE